MAEAKYPSATSSDEEHSRTQNFNQKFGEFRKFVSTNFTRTRQFTLEKVGKADSVTEYDAEFDTLCRQLDQIKQATERILSYVECIVQPNPGIRLENVVYNRLNRPKPSHSLHHELLATELARSGNLFGSETQYGSYLIRCAEVEGKLGQSERRFQEKVKSEFMTPLKAFLEIDVKTALEAKKVLVVKRLDLDVCRTRSKKAPEGEKLEAAEAELRTAQAEYDMQLGKVRFSLKRIVETHVNHLGHLQSFMAMQRNYHSECLAQLGDVAGDISTVPPVGQSESGGVAATSETSKFSVQGLELDREDSRKAKVLYDYDAENKKELTVNTDQVITVTPIPDDDDFVMAEFEGSSGKIPSTYVEFL